ncbi:anti-sigma factor domain-containing protein [uncultured Clostridium sp.]|uniref:anti-sigma factor domain-containing protein n=1 Tax=uncultured Clostridium sp. TaxID=59620 RepID=UPI0025D3E142|nr:anti-sigma factor domain-containing protein [uncultured Clostridium sp.]
MKKGLIMELKNDYAIVLNDDGGMEKIVIKPQMAVGQKIFYFDEDIAVTEEVSTSNHGKFKYSAFMKSFGSIAALFLIAFTFFYNMNINKTVAVVSLDINPSIQIEVDNNQNILKVTGMNNDGKNIDFSGIKGCNINDGIKAIKDILVEKEYLKNNRDVLVGFAFVKNGETADYEDNIKEAVLATFDSENVTYLKAEDKKDVDEAKEKGISLGRYEASKVVDEETKKKIVNAPVKEITEQIKDKGNVIYYDAEDNKPVESETSKNDNTSSVPADKQNADVSDSKINTDAVIDNSKKANDNKDAEGTANKKPEITAPVDEKAPVQSGNNGGAENKSEINNGVLELEPEKPESDKSQVNGQPAGGTTVIDPDKNVIENSPTSGKIEEDKVQEISPDVSVQESVKEEIK